MARLKRVSCNGPGIRRRRRGRGFSYEDERGRPVSDEAADRIRALAIPPAWIDVWICPDPMGHIQATGVDGAGRRQYLYHDRWRIRRDAQKFERVEEFAKALPQLREACSRALASDGMSRERVLAGAVTLLDRTSFRIGSERYAQRNGSFGLSTIKREHVHVRNGSAIFDFIAKGGKRWRQAVDDPELVRLLGRLKRRRSGGDGLLAYRDQDGWNDVSSAQINEFIRELGGDGFTAKDFRTWHATVLAAERLARAEEELTPRTPRRRAASEAIADVAEFLGNTPAVCRASYVDPRVLDRFREGVTILPHISEIKLEALDDPAIRADIEAAVLDLLQGVAIGAVRSAA